MNSEIWAISENNTSVVEAALSLANDEGKQLKLLKTMITFVDYYLFLYEISRKKNESELQILAQEVATGKAIAKVLEIVNLEKKKL
ncbi:5871_t:CDS:2, partial [Diversispora eburnea]